MTGDIGAGGDVVAGALIARAVGGTVAGAQDGGRAGTGVGGTQCLNCGTALVGEHCHACGQVSHPHRTMGAIWHDIAHGVFHFEGKAFRTLPMLGLRPGELTRRYIDGERTRFVSPLALFLFSVFLMFAIVNNLPGWKLDGDEFFQPGLTGGIAETRTRLGEQRAQAERDIVRLRARLQVERARPDAEPARVRRLQTRLRETAEMRMAVMQAERLLPAPTTFDAADAPLSTDSNWLERKWRDAKANPKLIVYKIKTSAYKFSWALIPISLPFIWLLFPLRRSVGLYDHAIFATYSLTFMSLLVIVLGLLDFAGVSPAITLTAATFIPPLHMYKQLKGTYRLGRLGALWRLAWLLLFTMFTSTLFITLLLYLGVAD